MIKKMSNLADRSTKWWLVLGSLMILLGILLISSPIIATFATIVFFGCLLIAAGSIQAIMAFLDKHATHFWLHLVIAALSFVVGAIMLLNPAVSTLSLTLLIGAFFLTSGIFRIIAVIATRLKGWVWYLINGIISVFLGILILMHWPVASLWVIGLFMGIDLLFAGIAILLSTMLVKKGALFS